LSVGLCVVLIAATGTRSFLRNFDWLDEISCAEAIARSAPESPVAHMSLGMVYTQNLRFTEAEKEMKRAVELAPDRAVTHGRLGELYTQLNRFDDAFPELQRSLALSSRFDFVHIAMGRVYNHRGEYSKAVEAYRSGIAISPPDAGIYRELALILIKTG